MAKIISPSPIITRSLASRLGEKLLSRPSSAKHATVIALTGQLGAGKTVFAKGLARGLKIKKTVNSPTFLIFKIYPLKKEKNFKNFIHVDAYRLKNTNELKVLRFSELLKDPKNIILIEWAENIRKIIPKDAIKISVRPGKKEKERILESNRVL